MPSLPSRPCTHPGCPALVERGACPDHVRKDADVRQKTAARGYDADHRRLRILCFQRDRFRCVDCQWEPEIVRIFREEQLGTPPLDKVLDELRRAYARKERHLHADHEVPIEQAPELRLVLSNLRTRCNLCHARKTAGEDGGFGNAIVRA